MLYLTNVYGAKFGASALAANGLLRYLVGGSFALFTIPSESPRHPKPAKTTNKFSSVPQPDIPMGVKLTCILSRRICLFAMDLLHVWWQSPQDQCLHYLRYGPYGLRI